MIIQAYLKINKEELSTSKSNVIYYSLDGSDTCGQVVKIHEEVSPRVFRCDIMVYKEKTDIVLEAMRKERMELEGRT